MKTDPNFFQKERLRRTSGNHRSKDKISITSCYADWAVLHNCDVVYWCARANRLYSQVQPRCKHKSKQTECSRDLSDPMDRQTWSKFMLDLAWSSYTRKRKLEYYFIIGNNFYDIFLQIQEVTLCPATPPNVNLGLGNSSIKSKSKN